MALFYRPDSAWAADFIPFYQDGVFHLFYLLDWRDPANHGEGTPWYQISTRDLVHFEEHGEMLARGTPEEQDLYVFTGSVVEARDWPAAGGRYHIFYTGHNPHFRRAGKPEQGVMHAVSDDLLRWRKIPEHTFFAPPAGYEPHDWRDPFVFWNDEAGEYWMLLAARLTEGPSRRRGCTALCASTDLVRWEVRDPFYAPGLYFTHECPDLFRMGEWWYLLFSEFSEKSVTRYRMSRSLRGPWTAPPADTFDCRVHYAAKTAAAADGRRFLFGWNATRQGEKDDGAWQWGGNLVVHEIFQRADGTLGARPPEALVSAFGPGGAGRSERLSAPGGFTAFSAGDLPGGERAVLLEAEVTFQEGTRGAGLFLRGSADFEQGYYLRIEPEMQRLVFDRWPRPGDQPFQPESERRLNVSPGRPVRLQVFLEGSVLEVYVDGQAALSYRLYELQGAAWGGFVQEGEAAFAGLQLRQLGE